MWSELRKIWHETPSGNPSGNPSSQIDQDASANKEQSPHKVSRQRPPSTSKGHGCYPPVSSKNANVELKLRDNRVTHIVSHGYIKLHPNRMILEPHVPPILQWSTEKQFVQNKQPQRSMDSTLGVDHGNPLPRGHGKIWNRISYRGIFKLPANGLLMIVS